MTNGKSPLKILGPEILGLFVAFAVILGALNYFNILSFSQLYPNLFGRLPHQGTNYSGPLSTPQAKIEQKEFICPSPLNPCEGKKVYSSKGNLLGLGFIAQGNVLAAISGEINFESKEEGEIDEFATIVNKDKGYKATYNFIGEKTKNLSPSVVAGEPIGSSSATFFEGKEVNLIFKLEDRDGKYMNLSASDFQL